jgi:DNA-binding GntR family transcriptional regulator
MTHSEQETDTTNRARAAKSHVAADPTTVPQSARERAYDALLAAILRGDVEPGAFLEEALACELTGVSRTPVREAISRLAAEGYLTLLPRRGAMVRTLAPDELRDLFDVRRMIEAHAIGIICRDKCPIPVELGRLCELHEKIPAGDFLAFTALNQRFHRGIIQAARNQVLMQVFDNLRANLNRVAMLSFKLGVSRTTEAEQHRALVAALARHDEAAALGVLDLHLRRMPRIVSSLQTPAQTA